MASNKLDTKYVLASLARLTGKAGESVKHGQIFRVKAISSEGTECGVPIRIDDHPTETRPYALNQIADSLRVNRKDIYNVIETWTPEMLMEHLAQFTQEELKPVRLR